MMNIKYWVAYVTGQGRPVFMGRVWIGNIAETAAVVKYKKCFEASDALQCLLYSFIQVY
jgi:hypothetical protein